jgi:hypothetical protein
MLAHPQQNIIFLEVRNEESKKVSFSAVDLDNKSVIFENLAFEEPWWISLAEVSGQMLIFKIYIDTNNPDKKSIIAYDFHQKKTAWWRNNYAVSGVNDSQVMGTETGLGMKFLALNLTDGLPSVNQSPEPPKQNFLVRKPLQYYPETSHFETVKSFLNVKHEILAVSMIEYLEFRSLIFISCYINGLEKDLANYLIVLDEEGQVLLKERIGEHLKGIGIDTFFILSGYLIFAKNTRELVSYKMV